MRTVLWVLAVVLIPLPFLASWIDSLWEAMPFSRIMNRCIMLAAVLSIFPLARAWSVASWRDLGVHSWKLKQFLLWFLFGTGTVFLLLLMHTLAATLTWRGSLAWYKPLEFLASGLAVGLAEELLFRGLLFHALKKFFKSSFALWTWALVLSSLFATLHFLQFQNPAPAWNAMLWWEVWSQAFPTACQWQALFPRWLSLVGVGMILCATTYRHGHLWGAIALHAGWVFMLKLCATFSEVTSPSLWWGSELYTGAIPTLILVMLFFLILYARPRKTA